MSDVFISYSRRDSGFVRALADGLAAAGKDVWVDVEGIRDAERFPEALRAAIQGADAFVFVISPDSVRSAYCELEVAHAAELNKRLIPIALVDVPAAEVPEELRVRNWIPVVGNVVPVARVVAAVDTDLRWEKQHTRLTVKALEWSAAGRDASFLLRGSDLAAAEDWLAVGATKDPGPTELEHSYLLAGRRATTARQRLVVGASLLSVVVALALLVFALFSRGAAVSAKRSAQSQALAAYSQSQLAVDPAVAVQLGIAAVATKPSYGPLGSMFALRGALDASALRGYLRSGSGPDCTYPGESEDGGGTTYVSYTTDGRTLVQSECDPARLRVIDPANTRLERTIALHGDGFFYALVGPHDAVVDPNGRLELLDLRSGRVLRDGPECVAQGDAASDPRAPEVAFPEAGDIVEWDVLSGVVRRLALPHTAVTAPSMVTYSPDGQVLAVASQSAQGPGVSGVMTVDAASGRLLATASFHMFDEFTSFESFTVAFSPNGREIAADDFNAATGANWIELYDATTLSPLRRINDPDAEDVIFSPDGSQLIDLDALGAQILTLTGQRLASLSGDAQEAYQMAYSPDGRQLAVQSLKASLQVWSAGGILSADRPIMPHTLYAGAYVQPTGRGGLVLASVTPENEEAVQGLSATGAPVGPPLIIGRVNDGRLGDVFVSPDGRFAAIQLASVSHPFTSEPIDVWNIATRRMVRVIPATTPPNPSDANFLAPRFVDRDRKIAISVSANPQMTRASDELIDIATGAVDVVHRGTCQLLYSPSAVAVNASGSRVAYAHGCGTLQVYDTGTGTPVGVPLHVRSPSAITLNPSGHLLAALLAGKDLSVTDTITGRTLYTFDQDTKGIDDITFSPDGHYLAVAGEDGTLRILDVRTGVELRLIQQPAPLNFVRFSENGQQVYTLDKDGVLRGYAPCPDCQDPSALLALARTRAPVPLTAEQRTEYSVG